MDGIRTTKTRSVWRQSQCCRIIVPLIIILVARGSPAAEPGTDAHERTAAETKAPPRLSQLGLEQLMKIEVTTMTRQESAEPFTVAPDEQTAPEPEAPFRLAPLGLEQLMEIEVTTVTRREGTVGESAAAIYVITQEDIRRSGATTIPELFRRVPGMNVARMDNNKWAISARGFNDRLANKLLVQIDGRVLYNPLFSGVFWDSVDYPLEDIERIEIIRGPGASVWGANAVNGIINIITKSAKDTQGGLLSVGVGNEEKGFGTLRFGGKLREDFFFRVYGKGFDREKQFSPVADPNDDWRGISGGFRFDWQKTERDLLTFQGDYLWSEPHSRSLLPQKTPPFLFTSLEPETTKDVNLLGRWTHQVDGDSSWSIHFYWEHFDRKLESMKLKLRWNTYDLDFQHQFKWGDRQKIVYGLGNRLIEMSANDSDRDEGFFLSWNRNRREAHVISAFVHDEIAVVENRLSLILGSKFEHNDKTGFEVQPTFRLIWTPSERQTVWAAVSRAVRTPHEAETGVRTRSLPVTTVPLPVFPLVIGDPDLNSENLVAYELGYRVQATENLSVDSSLFYNVYDNVTGVLPGAIQPGQGGTLTLPLTLINGLDAEAYGAELSSTWQVTQRWRLYAAYSFLNIHLHRRERGLQPETEAAERQSPQNQIYLQSSLDLPRGVELDIMGRYVDQIKALIPGDAPSVENEVASYIAFDARLAWKPGKDLTLEIVGRNLLDNRHAEFGTNPFFRSEPAEIERSIYGKVTWRF